MHHYHIIQKKVCQFGLLRSLRAPWAGLTNEQILSAAKQEEEMDLLLTEAWLTLLGSETRGSNLGIVYSQKMELIIPPRMSLLNKVMIISTNSIVKQKQKWRCNKKRQNKLKLLNYIQKQTKHTKLWPQGKTFVNRLSQNTAGWSSLKTKQLKYIQKLPK